MEGLSFTPSNPLESALNVVNGIESRRGSRIAVIVSDSRLTPTRMGTIGVALAAVGVLAVRDLRGRLDLFGNPLKVTRQAIADDLCSGAQLVMGESDEASPVVLVRGLEPDLIDRESKYSSSDFSIPIDKCVYLRSLGYIVPVPDRAETSEAQ
jgi:F420-0:gamma-glutamyl ligase